MDKTYELSDIERFHSELEKTFLKFIDEAHEDFDAVAGQPRNAAGVALEKATTLIKPLKHLESIISRRKASEMKPQLF